MENKDWREEFDKKCKKFEFDGAYETDVDLKLVKPFIESILKSKQEEIKKVKFNRYDEYGDFCEEVVGLDDIIKILK